MNKLIILILVFISFINLSAEIAVKSFRKLESDMTARIEAPKKDQNGDVCAIIKVVTTQTGFVWEPDGLGIVAAIPKVGEYWLYIPFSAKRLTLKQSQLGVLRDYMYPLPIEKATVYEMVLITGKVITTVEETIESQWLVINPEPTDAAIYIDDIFVKTGTYSAKHKSGNYIYRVVAPLYHTEAGKIEISDFKKELTIKLKPAFGYISVSTEPEQDAKVIIDGKTLTDNTPTKSEALASGQHTVQVIKEMYQPTTQKVNVTDGQTTPIIIKMQPNFAEVTISSAPEATLFVNGIQKGIGSWSGKLSAGIYTLESRRNKHKSVKQDIELEAGDIRKVDLQPTPIYGSLDIISTPLGANILINGTDYGTTPNTINKLLIGDYTLMLSKQGYANLTRTISISEGKTSELNETLSNGKAVSISSTPTGANLYIDNVSVGITPYDGNLSFGSHTLRIEQGGKRAEKTVKIAQTGGETSFNMSYELNSFTETVNGVSFDMVAVKGGTFQMGSNDGESNEKPLHLVIVSDFYIGKTEVTQALWQAVMYNNPSSFKGNNLPVENVSWYMCQEFIQKLNQLSTKIYRLPTEAEWEYAAGDGTLNRAKRAGANNQSNIAIYAWYSSNSGNKSQQVATKQPNALGLHDMFGNVWEWCSDWYDNYSKISQTNPNGSSTGIFRIYRGGGWGNSALYCRSSNRGLNAPYERSDRIGFRIVLAP